MKGPLHCFSHSKNTKNVSQRRGSCVIILDPEIFAVQKWMIMIAENSVLIYYILYLKKYPNCLGIQTRYVIWGNKTIPAHLLQYENWKIHCIRKMWLMNMKIIWCTYVKWEFLDVYMYFSFSSMADEWGKHHERNTCRKINQK